MKNNCSAINSLAIFGVFLLVVPTFSFSYASCRSNSTHIAWVDTPATAVTQALRGTTTEIPASPSSSSCAWQTITEAKEDLYNYLRQNIMQFDRPNMESLGFFFDNEYPYNSDDLQYGLIGQDILSALNTKVDFPYSDALPKRIWQEYVLNYANVNEARTNWRPLLWKKLRPLVQEPETAEIDNVVRNLNIHMWQILAPKEQQVIYFKSYSTPLMIEPLTIMDYGYASCTGTSLLFVNALRSLGIAARVVGTPAWKQNPNAGNHNWVEVWKDGEWYFLEPSLSTDPNKPLNPTHVDNLSKDPCSRWFCNPKVFSGFPNNATMVYAARLEEGSLSRAATYYNMAWEPENHGVPGDDRSQYYLDQCGNCGGVYHTTLGEVAWDRIVHV